MNITIKFIKTVNKEEFITLYKEAGWWSDDYYTDLTFIDNIVNNSFLFAGAYDNSNRLIGMGRAISDGCSDAYIQDVVVLREYRNKGIGGNIIKKIIEKLQRNGIDWIGLIGEPGTENFYKEFGFKKLDHYIPMKLT